jgi:hypothetical protein
MVWQTLFDLIRVGGTGRTREEGTGQFRGVVPDQDGMKTSEHQWSDYAALHCHIWLATIIIRKEDYTHIKVMAFYGRAENAYLGLERRRTLICFI